MTQSQIKSEEPVLPDRAMNWITLGVLGWVGLTTFKTAVDVAVLRAGQESAHANFETRINRIENLTLVSPQD
jgi:hypothetical protein